MWPPSLTRYLPVIRWRYASRRHREVALCHGALFRFVCSLASINHVLPLPHPLFNPAATPLLFPSSSAFFDPPSLSSLHGVARSLHRKWVHSERRPLPWENHAEVRRCVEDEFGEDVISRFYFLRREKERLMSWVKLKCWLFELIGYGRCRYGKRWENVGWRLVVQCSWLYY